MRVRRCDLELVEIIEDIELGKVERGVVVASVRVLEDDEIEPSATALATGCDTDFVADLLELFTDFVQLLGGEGATVSSQFPVHVAGNVADSRSNTGSVCLHYTNDLLDRAPSQSKTSDNASETCVRGCDEGICAVVNVEHKSVGSLNQDLCVLLLR